MNRKILQFFLLTIIGLSLFHSPIATSATEYADDILSNFQSFTSSNPIKSKTLQDTPQQLSQHIGSNNPLYESVLARYQQGAAHNSKIALTDNVISKLISTPKTLWHTELVNLIVTYNVQSPQIKQTLQSQYDAKILSTLPVAFVKTTLSETVKLSELSGITNIYLDRYYQFLDPAWKNLSTQVLTYPSEAYIGARALLDLGIDGSGIKIAIVDTGIDSSHPDLDDLDNNPATNDPKVIAEASFIDYDFDGVNDTDVMDEFGHGTHCAGIAAANGTLKGVAPGAYLMNARALDASGGAYVSWVVNAINWAVANGADVISMSIGWAPGDVVQLLNEAADAAWDSGSIVVVAAGNSGPYSGTVSSPGMASRAITVGASNLLNTTTYWSSRGPSTNGIIDPDVVAPGENILSTIPGNTYAVYSGTSMATPAVAGVAALLRSAYPSVDIDLIRSAIISTATDIGENIFQQGAGLVNALGAFEYLQEPTNFAYPSFSSSSPLKLSPNERFEYQFDIFVNQSYQSLTVEPSTNLVPYVNVSFIDAPTQSGWIRANVEIIMPDTSISGNLFVKNGTTTLYTTVLCLEPDLLSNDANSNADAGETLGGAIPINVGVAYSGGMFAGDMQDFYSFAVSTGHSYKVTLDNLTDDFDVIVTDENGTMIAVGNNWDIVPESVNFTAITTGDYYLRIIGYGEGFYDILVEELPIMSTAAKLVLTENYDNYAVDEDSNGLYDYLALTVEVNVTAPGYYDILYSISQYREDYIFPKYIVVTDWLTTYLDEGISTIELPVPAYTIEQSNYDGPYILTELLIGDPITWQILEHRTNLFNTANYAHDQFEPSSDRLTSYSYSDKNIDGIGGPEIFEINCAFTFNTIGSTTIILYILNDAHTSTITYQSTDITVNSPISTTVTFSFSGDLFKSYDGIVVAGINLIKNNTASFIPIYDIHSSSEFSNYEPLVTYQISDKILDNDNTGLYETLQVDILVTSKIESTVTLGYLEDLFSLSKERMLHGGSQYPIYKSETLKTGDNHFYLNFDLISASTRNLDGPYLLPFIALKISTYGIKITTYHTTQFYDSQTFDKPEAYVSNYFGANKILTEDGGIELTFEITAESSLNIQFWISVEAIEVYSFYFYTFKDLTLSQGKNNISVLIPYEDLFHKKFIGTLKISDVGISSNSGILDELVNIAVIRDVDYRDFNAFFEAYIVSFDVAYVDNDTDSLYEGINITVQVHINNPGNYEFALRIDSISGGSVYFSDIISCPTQGDYNHSFFIPASFVVRQLSASNGLAYLQLEVINTETYWADRIEEKYAFLNIEEFDYTLPLVYHRFLSVTPFDENNDGLFDGLTVALEWNVTFEGEYGFAFYFSTYPPSSGFALDAFNVEINTYVHFTKGIQHYTFNIDAEKLKGTKDMLDLYGEKEFRIVLREITVYDFEGSYHLNAKEDLQSIFDITQFDARPAAEIVDVAFALKDINEDTKADYLEVYVTISVNKPIDSVIVEMSLYYTYMKDGGYYSISYHTEKYVSLTVGSQKVTVSVSLYQLFEEIPDNFEISADVYLLTTNYGIIDSYSAPYQSLNTYIPHVTTPITSTTPTKKHDFPIAISFLVLFGIALLPLLRRKTK